MQEITFLLTRDSETALSVGESAIDVVPVKPSPEELALIKDKDPSVIKILANATKKPLAVKHFTIASAIESAEALLAEKRKQVLTNIYFDVDRNCFSDVEFLQQTKAQQERKAAEEIAKRANYEKESLTKLLEQERLPLKDRRCLHEDYHSLEKLEASHPGYKKRYENINASVRDYCNARNEICQLWGQAIELGLLSQNNDMGPDTALRRQFDQNLMPDGLLLDAFVAMLQPIVGVHNRVRISERKLSRRFRMTKEQFIDFEEIINKSVAFSFFPLNFAIREFADKLNEEHGFQQLDLKVDSEINVSAKEDRKGRLIYALEIEIEVSSEYFGTDHKSCRKWSVFFEALNNQDFEENDDD